MMTMGAIGEQTALPIICGTDHHTFLIGLCFNLYTSNAVFLATIRLFSIGETKRVLTHASTTVGGCICLCTANMLAEDDDFYPFCSMVITLAAMVSK
jgi:hypothetical protein